LFINIFFHRVVVLNTAETDAYFIRADELLRYGIYTDFYRPPLYTLLVAILSRIGGFSTFLAASLLSAFSAGFIIFNTYVLARSFLPETWSFLVMFLVAVNGLVIQYGLCGCTDALFAALSLSLLITITLLCHNEGKAIIQKSFLIGILFGLLYLTRYVAVSLIPIIVIGIWQVDIHVMVRLKSLSVTLLTAFIIALPWFSYNTIVNGTPFANDNWRNFAFAIYGQGDYNYLRSTIFTGYLDVFMHDPYRVFLFWKENVLTLARYLPFSHSSSLALAVFLPIGVVCLVKNRPGRLLVLYILAASLPIVLTFVYMARLFLAITPIVILVAIIGMVRIKQRWPAYKAVYALLVAVIVLLAARTLPITAKEFLQSQPTIEVDMIDQLVRKLPVTNEHPLRIVSTYKYAANFVESPNVIRHYYVPFYDRSFPELLVNTVSANNVDYILISDLTSRGALQTGRVDRVLPTCWIPQQETAIPAGVVRLYKNECAAAS
jgi:4-amino-4-deoxy-L-arabinose transferase-like glycosyltransferase